MCWHVLGFLLRATAHEDASFRHPRSADTRRIATEIDSPDLSDSNRLVLGGRVVALCFLHGVSFFWKALLSRPETQNHLDITMYTNIDINIMTV